MMKMTKKASIFVLGLVAFVMLITSFFFATTVSATVSDDLISIMPGAEVRIDTDNDAEDKTGIRFTINVNKEKYEALTAEGGEYAGYTASIGAAVIPTKYLGIDELDAKNTVYNYNGQDKTVLHIPLVNKIETVVNEGTENEFTQQTYKAVVRDIPANNYETELSVKGYIKLTAEGQDDVYIQTDVVARSIGKVITTFYTATDPELAPNEFQKPVLEKMIENGVKPSLAAKLDDGYLADFSSSSYNALVEEMKPDEFNDSISWDIVDFDGLTNVLKVDMVTATNTNAGFILNLPKAAGQNKLQVKLYVACDVSMGFNFYSPDDGSTLITDDLVGSVKNQWSTQTLDYSTFENTDQLYVHAFSWPASSKITVYVAFVRLEKQMNPTGYMLADYESYAYDSSVLGLSAGTGTRGFTTTYLDEFSGETGVLKVALKEHTTSYYAFKLKLPKAATANKVDIRMYIEYSAGCGLIFGNPDTAGATSGDYLGTQSWTATKGAWATYAIDYSQYSTKDEIEVVMWGNGTDLATFYISWVQCVDLTLGLEEGCLADYSNKYYESTVSTSRAPNGSTTILSAVTYMDEFESETGVLKIDMVATTGGYFGFTLNLPKNIGTNKVKIKIYDAYTAGQGPIQFFYNNTTTAINEGSISGSNDNSWKEYVIDYTSQEDTNMVVLSSFASAAGKEVTFYVSYVMIAE